MGREKKARMGRPPVDNPKKVIISIRVTSKERADLDKAAKKAGMMLSEYIMRPHRKKMG